jgi:hypothetical protein
VLVLACQGRIPRFDVALFADTGWEPRAVYRNLDRLTTIAIQAGIAACRIGNGDIRADALDPTHRFASMPVFTLSPDGRRGIARRQCTSEYKVNPLKREVRRRLGYPHPARVPACVFARIAIGISVEEADRARDSDVRYMRNTFPLLDLGWRRRECLQYLTAHGVGDTHRSSWVGCPFHIDDFWWRLRTDSPDEWADAVAFDHAIRDGSARANAVQPRRGAFYLHPTRLPLDQVVLRPRGAGEPDGPGCGPWTCSHTAAVGEVA